MIGRAAKAPDSRAGYDGTALLVCGPRCLRPWIDLALSDQSQLGHRDPRITRQKLPRWKSGSYGARTGAPGAGAPRGGNAGGPRPTPWPCIAMCTTLIRGALTFARLSVVHIAMQGHGEILSLPG